MGEIAEMMLDGTLCFACGVYIGMNGGFPQMCFNCEREEKTAFIKKVPRIKCHKCNKMLHPLGLKQHNHAKHK